LAQRHRWSTRYSLARLSVFLSGLIVAFMAFNLLHTWLGGAIALAFALVFGLLVYRHRRIEESLFHHTLWRELKFTQVARLKLNWEELEPTLLISSQPEHPFELDLDLTGKRSLHALIDLAVTRRGSQRLRDWLLTPTPDPKTILQRQALVRELAPLALFRDKLWLTARLASPQSRAHWESETLLAWLKGSALPKSVIPVLLILSGLAAVNIVLWVLSQLGLLTSFWIYSLLLYVLIYYTQRSRINTLFQEALSLENVLGQFQAILEYLETRTRHSKPHLRKLCEPLLNAPSRPSLQLKRIARVAQAAQLQRHPFLWPVVNALVPWDLYFVCQLHQYRTTIAKLLPQWLDVWFELEALLSLANFSYLNPSYVLPELIQTDEKKRELLHTQGLGHPLLFYHNKVCNDFSLERIGELAIVTGSNMSGKSTFLRTLGVNLSLAQAGGPVNASRFEFAPMRMFACIRVNDSLADGISYFYAEVRRLKALLVELEKPHAHPVFFLIDEIFKGTNNRERLIGSRAYIRALTRQNGLGLVATHDLELVKLADEMASIKNYHFREEVLDSKMRFDYRLHPGPCPTTNALKIMQMEGLPI
jgi:hypothetical protein